ncbi:MAG: UrcA family protein [Pseudomonadota bacterium]|nr:UrcA family protein [Pseudomonadota bacterium]
MAMAPAASAKERPVVVVAPADIPTRRVGYADLNLATSTGEKTLNHRVAGAVRSVCKEAVGNAFDFYGMIECRDFAWDGARPQMKRAVRRAQDIAATGSSSIAVAAIVLAAHK